MSVTLELGLLSPKISQQLGDAGLPFEDDVVEIYDRDAAEISRLLVRGYISDSAARTARKRLMRKLRDAIPRWKRNATKPASSAKGE